MDDEVRCRVYAAADANGIRPRRIRLNHLPYPVTWISLGGSYHIRNRAKYTQCPSSRGLELGAGQGEGK
jgi:hypothetical protein